MQNTDIIQDSIQNTDIIQDSIQNTDIIQDSIQNTDITQTKSSPGAVSWVSHSGTQRLQGGWKGQIKLTGKVKDINCSNIFVSQYKFVGL